MIPYVSHLFPNRMASSVKKMNICLVITLLMFSVLVTKKKKKEILILNPLLNSFCMMATAPCGCTFPSHWLLLSFLFPSPFFSSHSPPLRPSPSHPTLCLVTAAEGCTLSGLTRCPLRGSGLLAAAPGDTTRSPEPCSGMAGSPSHVCDHEEADV